MSALYLINITLGVVFALCYFYQYIFLFIAYLEKPKKLPDASAARLGILIAARNEERVVHSLLDSLKSQDYPRELYTVFVIADNCTDYTAKIAKNLGATVYERQNELQIGKGYAIDFLIKRIWSDFGTDYFDAFVIFDADNTLEPDFLTEINKTFALGYDVVTSYRAASNYGENWRAAGQGMYFIRESRIMNLARMRLRATTFVTGTGFLFSKEICKRYGGWPFHSLTEDGEFSMHNAVCGVKCGYCNSAVFYDEQATDIRDSWYQRLRWCKGGLWIFKKYMPSLARGIFSRRFFSSFDMLMCLAPAYILTLLAIGVNIIAFVILALLGENPLAMLSALLPIAVGAYILILLFSIPLTVSEWKHLRATPQKKILYAFTFPLFLFTFIPAALVALFKKVKWRPVSHGKKR